MSKQFETLDEALQTVNELIEFKKENDIKFIESLAELYTRTENLNNDAFEALLAVEMMKYMKFIEKLNLM